VFSRISGATSGNVRRGRDVVRVLTTGGTAEGGGEGLFADDLGETEVGEFDREVFVGE
jgi:hypothetical protein